MLACDLSGPAGAPVVVLGGSLGTARDMWHSHAAALAARFRVIAFDHRGHGASPVPAGPYRIDDLGGDVLELLDHLGLDRVHYAGASLGGMVGMWLAAHAPERVDRLALVCTSAHLPPAELWRDRAAAVRRDGMGGMIDAVLDRWFTAGFRAAHPELVAPLVAQLAATPPEGYAGCCEAIAAMDLRPVLPRIVAPTLVVAGAEDPATPPEHARAIVAAVPGARLEILSPAAHLAVVERAGAVLDLLGEHLDG